jgi:DNA repair protein RadC
MKVVHGPREKLNRFGPSALALSELVSVLLGSGTKRESVFEISDRVFSEYGISPLLAAREVRDVQKLCGVGPVKAGQLLAALEIGRRMYDSGTREFPVLRQPSDVATYLSSMARLTREQFRCLYLNAMNRLIRDELISVGSLNSTHVHPREVFHYAAQYSAASVILVHNHPSGQVQPSKEDRLLTARFKKAAKLLGVTLLDHMIIGSEGWFSFLQSGLLMQMEPADAVSPDALPASAPPPDSSHHFMGST